MRVSVLNHPTTDKCREMPQSFNKRTPVVLLFSKGDGSFTPKELRSRKCHAPVAKAIDFITDKQPNSLVSDF